MAYTFHPLHPTIPKYPTVSLIWVAAEPFSEACCSACIGLFVPSSSTASSAIPAKHHWPTNSGPAVMGSKAHISSVSSAARWCFAKLGHIFSHCLRLCFGSMSCFFSKGFIIYNCQQTQRLYLTPRLFLVSMHYNSHPGADATKPNADVHPCRKGKEKQCAPQNPHAASLSPLASCHMHQPGSKAFAKQHNPACGSM